MTDKIDKFFNKATTVNLSNAEKENIRNALFSQMEDLPVKDINVTTFAWETFFYRHTLATALVVVLLLGGATTTLAEKAFPGDLLYGIKTKVNEQVLGFFARGSISKAQWHLELAERRLRDVEYLSKETSVSEEIKQDVRQKLEEETRQAEESADNLTETGEDQAAISDVSKKESIVEEASQPNITTFSALKVTDDIGTTSLVLSHEELQMRNQEVMKKIPLLRRAILENKELLPTVIIGLKKELFLAEKAIFEASESLEKGLLENAESFVIKAEDSVIKIEDTLPFVPDISERKTDKKFSNKNMEVGNALESIRKDGERESVPSKN